MTTLSIQPPFPIFTDIDGQPLEAGYVWIGSANLNPLTNPIAVYWDAALTLPAAQPIRTIGGYPANNGTPGVLYVNSDYSIQVQNKNGSVVYSAPAATERVSTVIVTGGLDSANVTYAPAGVGAVTTTVEDKLHQSVSIFDYMSAALIADVEAGTLLLDCTAAFNAALAASKNIYFPPGKYRFNSTFTITGARGLTLYGAAAALLAAGTGYSGTTELYFSNAASGSDGLVLTDFLGVSIKDMAIVMRRGGAGGGKALYLYNGHDYSLQNVKVDVLVGASGRGIQLGNGSGATSTFVGHIQNVKVMSNSAPGIYANFGTSLTFTACYVIGGWMQFDAMTYCTAVSCAVDASTLYGYIVNGSSNLVFSACGAEGASKGAFYLSTTASNIVFDSPYGAANNTSADATIGDLVHIDSSAGVVNSITVTNPTSVSPNAATLQNIYATAGTGFVEVYNTDLTLFSLGFGGNATWIREKLTVTGIWDQNTSWTPVLAGWTNVGSPTVTGKWQRKGKVVTFYVRVEPVTSISATKTTSSITGFPFTSPEVGSASLTMVDDNLNSYGACAMGPTGIIYPQTSGVLTVPISIAGTVLLT
jgi:hypothetical protein